MQWEISQKWLPGWSIPGRQRSTGRNISDKYIGYRRVHQVQEFRQTYITQKRHKITGKDLHVTVESMDTEYSRTET